MAKYYHIYIDLKPGVDEDALTEKMNLALDWYKYNSSCWIVKTTSDAQKWNERLKSLAAPEGNLLILKLDLSERQGWMSKNLWSWFKKNEETPKPD